MALDADLFRVESRPQRMKCGVALVLAALDPKDREVLRDALADRSVLTAAVVRVLAAEGHKVAQSTIARHRRGDCSCP